jgi:hypothetical protein
MLDLSSRVGSQIAASLTRKRRGDVGVMCAVPTLAKLKLKDNPAS